MPADKKPVLLVIAATNSAQGGVTGAAIGTEVVIDALRARCDIDLLELRTNGLGQLGAKTATQRLGSMLTAAWVSLDALFRQILRGLRGPRVDIVYFLPAASTLGMVRNAGTVLVARLFQRRARLVYHIRNGNYFEPMQGKKAALRRYVNRHADRILVLSETLLPESPEDCGLDPRKVHVLPNSIDRALIPDTPARGRSAPPPVRVLYLSNFIPEKGYMTLLEAGELLTERGLGTQFELTFRGKWLDSADRAAFEARAKKLGTRGLAVDVGGSISDRKVVQSLFAGHHVFCLPTCYAAEAQPRSILEAMANGCAVVSTRYRSIPDQVLPGETGDLIDRQDPGLLADALQRIAEGDIAGMGKAGTALFHRRFSPEAIRDQLSAAFWLDDPEEN